MHRFLCVPTDRYVPVNDMHDRYVSRATAPAHPSSSFRLGQPVSNVHCQTVFSTRICFQRSIMPLISSMLRKFLRLALKAILVVWGGRITLFWQIWITMTAISAISVAWVVQHAAPPVVRTSEKTRFLSTCTPRSSWLRSLTVLGLLALFLVCYIAVMLKWEDFAYYDNSYLTLFPLRALNYPPPIWTDNGRFFPLGHRSSTSFATSLRQLSAITPCPSCSF